jgi:hypothetical protein
MIWVHCPHINIDQGGMLDAGKYASIIPWLSNSHKIKIEQGYANSQFNVAGWALDGTKPRLLRNWCAWRTQM